MNKLKEYYKSIKSKVFVNQNSQKKGKNQANVVITTMRQNYNDPTLKFENDNGKVNDYADQRQDFQNSLADHH